MGSLKGSVVKSTKEESKIHSMGPSVSQQNPFFDKADFYDDDNKLKPSGNEDSSTDDPKIKLSSKFPKSYSYAILGGIIINIAMLLYSHLGLSAVINSSTCPEGFKGCPDPVNTDGLEGECSSNPSDAAILVPGNPAYDDVPIYMSEIGFDCLGQGACIQEQVMETQGLSADCAACFVVQADCSVENCFSVCIINSLSKKCLSCSDEFCAPLFENCTGIDFPDRARVLLGRMLQNTTNDDCFDKDEYELFKVFNLTFVNSISEALKGGSAPLAILIIIASGIWPYSKNLLMLYTWFAPLTQKRRDTVLRALAILGKWSLVDVFAVVLIINGVLIQKTMSGDSPLLVFAESRPGIYMFGIAAIWALLQGELIRYLEKKRLKQHNHNNNIDTTLRDPSVDEKAALQKYRLIIGVCSCFALMFGLLGLLSTNLKFQMDGKITDPGFAGPNSFDYNTFQMGSGLADDCAIYDGHESVPGAYFLASIFIIMCAIIPIISYMLLIAVAVTYHHSKTEDWFIGFAFGLANFAAMDVFFLSMITLANQFEGLIESAVGDGVDDQCGVTEQDKENGIVCIKFTGEIGSGGFLILVSILFFWAAQFASGKLIQSTYKLVGPLEVDA